MAAFKDRGTFLENITFMALMAAIVVIASVFAAFVPLGAVLVMIALPLPSAIVAYYCRPRYYAIYLFGAIGLAIAATAWNFSSTLFYTIPAVLTGLLYGFSKRKGASIALAIFLVAILGVGLSYLSILLIRLIYEVDMPSFLLGLVGLGDSESAKRLILAGIFTYSLIQAALSNLFINLQTQPLPSKQGSGKSVLLYPAYGLFLLAILLVLSFFEESFCYALLIGSLYWLVFALAEALPFPRKWIYAPLGLLFLLGVFFFYFFFQQLPLEKAILLLACPFAGLLLGLAINNFWLFKQGSDPTINEQGKDQC